MLKPSGALDFHNVGGLEDLTVTGNELLQCKVVIFNVTTSICEAQVAVPAITVDKGW